MTTDDNFILITAPEWIEVPNADYFVEHNLGEPTLNNMIEDASWDNLVQIFQDEWEPPAGKIVTGARVIKSDILHLWFRLADE